MARVALVFTDRDGRVDISVVLPEGQKLPEHPRLFTNAHECIDGVLKLLRQYRFTVRTLTEIVHEQSIARGQAPKQQQKGNHDGHADNQVDD